MIRSFKYRVYLNKIQCETLGDILYNCRFLYNCALEERISYYKRYGKTLNYYSQAANLKHIVPELPEFSNTYSQTRQEVLKQLDAAYKNFFRRVKAGMKPGFPRFKGENRFNSILFPQVKPNLTGGGVKRLPNNKLKVFGIPGEIKVWWHRPWKGRCKQARIKKEADKYYLILTCEEVPKEPLAPTNKTVGIDLGINNFIVGDDGLKIHHPRPLKKQQDKLIKAQQVLSRKKRGSNNRIRAKQRLARIHNKIKNIRNDFLHKTTKLLVQGYDRIFAEDLNIKGMIETSGFNVKNSNIADASWGNFIQKLVYKAESAGREVVLIDPKNTSKMCSCCGNIKEELSLKDRAYHCGACGTAIDRDRNAAINIKRLGTSLASNSSSCFQKSTALSLG